MKKPNAGKEPNPIDKHVGERIRVKRRAMKLSQERLADALGLTFQQVQKYERGTNRVSASKLYEIARFLSSPISYFFDDLADPTGDAGDSDTPRQPFLYDLMATNDGVDLAANFPRIKDVKARRKIVELVRVLADAPDSESDAG